LKNGIPAVCFLNSGFVDNEGLFYRYKASLLIGRLRETAGNSHLQKTIQDWFRDHQLPYTPGFEGLLQVSWEKRRILDELAVLLDYNFREYLKRYRPYMDSGEIRSLISQGFSFGAHSIDHPEYRFIPEQEQFRQTSVSIRELEEKFDLKLRLFSFPFTDFGVKQQLFDALFDPSNPLADLTFGGAGLKNDSVLRNIQRIPFEGTGLTANQILSTEYVYFVIKSIFGKNLIRR
jgi:peptidoglycan/xylan/chitin deacetylase (PgdA/CDA1 family)